VPWTFNHLAQYAGSPGNRAYCYTELAGLFFAVAISISSTHLAYLQRLSWLSWLGRLWRRSTHLSPDLA